MLLIATDYLSEGNKLPPSVSELLTNGSGFTSEDMRVVDNTSDEVLFIWNYFGGSSSLPDGRTVVLVSPLIDSKRSVITIDGKILMVDSDELDLDSGQ